VGFANLEDARSVFLNGSASLSVISISMVAAVVDVEDGQVGAVRVAAVLFGGCAGRLPALGTRFDGCDAKPDLRPRYLCSFSLLWLRSTMRAPQPTTASMLPDLDPARSDACVEAG